MHFNLLLFRCPHSNKAGQELCYLCHQRARKNIPVYLNEERKMKEYEKDRLLQQYQHDKDVGAILKEQVIPISFCMPPDRLSQSENKIFKNYELGENIIHIFIHNFHIIFLYFRRKMLPTES